MCGSTVRKQFQTSNVSTAYCMRGSTVVVFLEIFLKVIDHLAHHRKVKEGCTIYPVFPPSAPGILKRQAVWLAVTLRLCQRGEEHCTGVPKTV